MHYIFSFAVAGLLIFGIAQEDRRATDRINYELRGEIRKLKSELEACRNAPPFEVSPPK